MSTAIIISNGTINDYSYYSKYLDSCKFVICADGGATHARKFGIVPDILLGDFDSIPTHDLEFFRSLGVEILKFPTEKDMTDTELAVDLAIKRGYDELIFIGGLGTRLDHSLSNIFILKMMLYKGIKGVIVNENNEIALINSHIRLQKEDGIKVTLLPLSEKVDGVTTKGFYYKLDNATLFMGSSWGVSNEFVEDTAEVSITSGYLLVIKARD